MKLKHTPGPWKVITCGGTTIENEKDFHVVSNGKEFICSTWGKPNIPNARLIAAAPEMLEELIEALDRSMRGVETSKINAMRLKDIIESATGFTIEEVLK